MNTYKFALSYHDAADDYVGFVLVDVIAESAERASLKIEKSKRKQRWLIKALGGDIAEDIDGIIVGEHVQIGSAATEPDRVKGKESRASSRRS